MHALGHFLYYSSLKMKKYEKDLEEDQVILDKISSAAYGYQL